MLMENTSSSYKLLSHPDKPLIDHLQNVGNMAKEMVNSKEIDNRDVFSEVAYLIGISHDFGKATIYFQKWLNEEERTKYARHSFLSALFGYFLVRHHLKRKNQLERFWYLPGIAWLVIEKHHTNIRNLWNEEAGHLRDPSEIEMAMEQLENIDRNYPEEIRKIYELLVDINIEGFLKKESLGDLVSDLLKDIKKITRESFQKGLLIYYFFILFFYSVLLDADKLNASGRSNVPERLDIPYDIVDDYKREKFRGKPEGINLIREEAYKEIISELDSLDIERDRILSINLPTGTGKTLTGLSFAIKLKNKIHAKLGFSPRIIYALPFLSIIDQNAAQIEDILRLRSKVIPSNLFLKHHHLADIEYKEESESEVSYEDFNKSLLLTEGWHSEIVITTFVQLFHSLITNRNRAARKFHNMTNSIILLDEVQAIPSKFWDLVERTLEYLAYQFNTWIILMTATQPLIFPREKIREIVINKPKYFNALDRVNYNFTLEKKEFSTFKKEFLQRILDDDKKSYMVVLNTIGSCKELYEYLKKELCKKFGYDYCSDRVLDADGVCIFPSLNLLNLSTHVLPEYRLKRIEKIRNRDLNMRAVIISTQLIEAGVDINVDVVYRDLAPLDCIVQAGGRCNRSDTFEKGEVNIINLTDDSRSKRQFWSYIYDPMLVGATIETIKDYPRIISERKFVTKAITTYYRFITERIAQTTSRQVIESVEKLNFSDIFLFKLIEEKLKMVSVFVEINENAERTRKQIEKIIATKKSFEKRAEIRKLRNEINSYTIHTYQKEELEYLEHLKGFDDYFYIEKEGLGKWYKKDTGLHLEAESIESVM
ncbi:MAG: CRISPR-associated endonuclease Cas3'' [Candidatus Methanofastidiosia archaeon]